MARLRLRADVAELAAMSRGSASEGERRAAAWTARRLGGELERFRFQSTYTGANAVHIAAGILAARTGRRLPALAAAVSLELEGSGRLQWIRRLLPASEGANVVRRIPGDGPTLVVHAHHDAARTGLAWHPALSGPRTSGALEARRIDGYLQPVALALLLCAAPWRPARRLGEAVLWLALASQADIATAPVVPGASDNATGVAALGALADDPPPGVDLRLVSCGCEESGMGGMAAFLARHRHELDPARTLFLSLDTLGGGTPVVLSGEGPVLEHRYAEADLALVDAAADRGGLPRPPRWRIGGWTDAMLARFAGYRAISVVSMGPNGFANYHRLSDTPANVDWGSVEGCLALAKAIAAEWVGRVA